MEHDFDVKVLAINLTNCSNTQNEKVLPYHARFLPRKNQAVVFHILFLANSHGCGFVSHFHSGLTGNKSNINMCFKIRLLTDVFCTSCVYMY